MSTGSTTQDDATVDTANTPSSDVHTVVECDNRGSGVDSRLLEIMGPTTSELQQLSALDDEGPPGTREQLGEPRQLRQAERGRPVTRDAPIQLRFFRQG
ncbi:hypothetical protein MRX96_036200 [Rhipicephalus microplus]